ncbi:retrovirus-related pol polyprotein from transposon TNT 1-94 [Tanacetum coccineum]
MDLCGPMRVQTINGKKYILVIVDDYSRFTWVKFLRSKDETPAVVIKFLTQIQVGLKKTVRFIRTDNGTEFVNKTLYDHYEKVGIFHQKTVPRTPQQNGVVERRNRTLVEAARTMLIFPSTLFLWPKQWLTALLHTKPSPYHTRHDKTPYELVHNKKPDLTFFRVFGALCYPTNDSENLGKLQPTADIGIFVVRTRNLSLWTPGPISSGLVPNPAPAIPFAPPTNKDLEMLFQPMFDEYFNPPGISQNPIPVIPTAASSTGEINIPESSQSTQHHEPVGNRLTHNQVITSLGNHSRTVSTKKTACHGCFVGFYNSVLSTDEPKNIHLPLLKTAWIYKLKLDEYGEFVEKKARLVAKGFRQGKV